MKRKTNKAKLEISELLKISALSFDKIGSDYALSANSMMICLLGYFCM